MREVEADTPVWKIADAVTAGSVTAETVTRTTLDRIAATNGGINAVTDLLADRALATARRVDADRSSGKPLGPMAGVPFAVKNLFDIKGLTTRAGSKINRDLPPATEDGVLIQRLESAGAVLVGALNMGEYAYDFTGENAHDGPCRNPHDPSRMAGGSSSGSGAAVGAGMVPLALGSDTNGSIRVPASFCGVFGLKPTYGRLSRFGSFPFCDSLDHLGPFAHSARDLALAYDVMQGPGAGDAASAERPVEPSLPTLENGISDLRCALLGGFFSTDGMPEAEAAVRAVTRALDITAQVEAEGVEAGRAAAFIITNVESANLHMANLQSRVDEFAPDTRDRFLAGALLPGTWYVRAQQVRKWYRDRFNRLFREFDILITPATPFTAPEIGQRMIEIRGKEVLTRPNIGMFTQPISAIGLPVCCVPVRTGRLPIGVQIIAPPWREDLCLRVAAALEKTDALGELGPAR